MSRFKFSTIEMIESFHHGKSFGQHLKAKDYVNTVISMKKETRGGARKGAGRPKTKEDTVVMRIPVSLVEKVKALISKRGRNLKEN